MRTPWLCVIVSALLASALPAHAQQVGDFVVSPDILLAANASGTGYMVNGVGSPAVAWDPNLARYLMVFEVKLPATDPLCPVGMWGLGLAYSSSPTTGWTTGTTPLLEPAAGTYYACVAANPSVMYNAATSTLTVWFKAEQTDPPDVAIGPSRFTGVGRVQVKFRASGQVRSVVTSTVPALAITENFGMPRVIRRAGMFEMMVMIPPDAWMASGVASSAFTLDAAPVMSPDPGLSWAVDELFNGSLVCDDDPVFPYAAFVGGKDTGPFGTIFEGGWGKAISANSDTWFLGADPYFSWVGDSEWRHWDVLRLDDPAGVEYLVWYDEKDASGQNQVRFASTIAVWDPMNIHTKDCP